jgi:hypothetical protein
MHLKRVWKPLVLATAIAATALFYSCKKFDPREHISKPAIEDTTVFEKKKFLEIGKRAFSSEKPMADTLMKDTLPTIPLKHQSEVVLSRPAK